MDANKSYEILGLRQGAGLTEIKKAYRRLAFQYHPDLNDDDPRAGEKFQQINAAYVFLRQHLESSKQENVRAGSQSAQGKQEAPKSKTNYRGQSGRQKQNFKAQKHKSTKASAANSSQWHTRDKYHRTKFYDRQEEILKEILNDPFARQVFEDIFQKVKQQAPKISAVNQKPSKLTWRKFPLAFKNWWRKQLDVEENIHLPASRLFPGSNLRIQIKHKWAGPPRTVNVTLPLDFTIGRPIRLKGLGRKIGPWQGDLYLRLLVK
ncbi:DnaJ domain-containing protein [Desulfovulcanus sp.]